MKKGMVLATIMLIAIAITPAAHAMNRIYSYRDVKDTPWKLRKVGEAVEIQAPDLKVAFLEPSGVEGEQINDVAICGNVAVVGSSVKGSAWIFRCNDVWTEAAHIQGEPQDNFGIDVAVSEVKGKVYVFVGKPNEYKNYGAIYIYDEDGNQLQKLAGQAGSNLGNVISANDDTMIADSGQEIQQIFTLDENGFWTPAPNREVNLQYDPHVFGQYAAGGAAEMKTVRVYRDNVLLCDLPMPEHADYIGQALDITNEFVVAEGSNVLWIYEKDGDKFGPPRALASFKSQFSVAAEGNFIIAGVYNDNDCRGSAWLFNKNGNNWEKMLLPIPDQKKGEHWGWWVDTDGKSAIVGSNRGKKGGPRVAIYTLP